MTDPIPEQAGGEPKKKSGLRQNYEIILQLYVMIRENRKWWLLPLLAVLSLLALFTGLAGNQSILPAIYALF